jgi:25S rRNA (adenine2142-N1)-methyltransferase
MTTEITAPESGDEKKAVKKKNRNSKREPLKRPRGKRGGVKHQKKAKSSTSTEASDPKAAVKAEKEPSAHSRLIANFHTIEKKLSQTTDEAEKKKLLAEREALGGLKAYQDASLMGADSSKGGESGKWIVKALKEVLGSERRDVKLLDVGSLSGTAFVKYPWIKAKSIDINPRGDSVERIDFFKLPVLASEEDKYDVVSFSLVVNFVGDIQERGKMLLQAHRHVKKGGHLALILPLACVANSRYCTHQRLEEILDSCGWKVVHHDE